MKIKIITFKTKLTDFDKKLVSFFILENCKNLQIIEIVGENLIFQSEFPISPRNSSKELLDKLTKIFPDKNIEIVSERDISLEEWKKMRIKSLTVGKFTFKPIFEKEEREENVIYLDTLVGAFGIDNHPTTILCLEMISNFVNSFRSAVDFGSGNGILSLSLAKISKSPIIAIEVFYNYCLEIKNNCRINNIENIFIFNTDSMSFVKEVDILVANVPISVFLDKTSGILNSKFNLGIFSGVKKQDKQKFVDLLENNHIAIDQMFEKEGWLGVLVRNNKKK